MSAPACRDWRAEYVICRHVEQDANAGVRHSGFRVCCQSCYDAGFLTAEPMETTIAASGLCVGVQS